MWGPLYHTAPNQVSVLESEAFEEFPQAAAALLEMGFRVQQHPADAALAQCLDRRREEAVARHALAVRGGQHVEILDRGQRRLIVQMRLDPERNVADQQLAVA